MHEVINRLRTKNGDPTRTGDEGFTLIELLVVVVIIGVLVAIAVPVYLNYRKGAADKSAQSDVRGAVSAVEQFYTDNGNKLPDSTSNSTDPKTGLTLNVPSGTNPQLVTMSDKTTLAYVKKSDGQSYMLCGTNSGGSGKWYVYDSSVGGAVQGVTPSSSSGLSLTTCK
jgi:type IV pilus assembly protein PilA